MTLWFITRCVEAKHAERARRREEEAVSVSPPASGTYSSVATGAAAPHHCRHHDVRVEMGSVDRFLDDILREKPARFTPENLREFTGGYAERLGAGGFGMVYRGRIPNGVQFQPSARPTMSSVVRMLEAGEMAIVPPVNPFHYVMSSGTNLSSRGTTGGSSEVAVSPPAKKFTDVMVK